MASATLENSIEQVEDLIESRQIMRALLLIKKLESKYPSSAQVLALKALVYAKTGHESETLSLCSDAKEKFLTDASVLPDVLNTLRSACQLIGRNDSATKFYEYACAEIGDSLDLMMGLFQCYVRESLFVNQVMISLKMYRLSGEDFFLMWAVCSIQLQAVYHLVKKHATTHNLDQPGPSLVYVSVAQQQGNHDRAREILANFRELSEIH